MLELNKIYNADVMEFMKEEGWKKKLFDGEWKHYCPECVESEKK